MLFKSGLGFQPTFNHLLQRIGGSLSSSNSDTGAWTAAAAYGCHCSSTGLVLSRAAALATACAACVPGRAQSGNAWRHPGFSSIVKRQA